MDKIEKYEEKIVCFIDILGFKKIIDESKEGRLDKLKSIYKIYSEFREENSLAEKAFARIFTTQFSDSMVFSMPLTHQDGAFSFITRLRFLLMRFAAEGILCRGGIAFGELYHDDEIVFGPALNEAYTLESEIAKYPRVVVGPDIIRIAKTFKGPQNDEVDVSHALSKILGYDTDGFYYVEYLDVYEDIDDYTQYVAYMDNLLERIERFSNHSDITISSKYNWLGIKYNECVMKLTQEKKFIGMSLVNIPSLIIKGVNDTWPRNKSN